MPTNNWKIKTILVTLYLITFYIEPVWAQNKIKVHVSGTSISRDITPKEALQEAIFEAQKRAYKEVGITEDVSVITTSFENSNGNKVNRYFNEISTIEANAAILVDSVYPEKRSFDEYGNMIIKVEIDATVYKYNKKKDPSLFFQIKGLKDTYYENELISFSFIPSQDGYLKIFSVNGKEAILLYPYKNPISDYLSDRPDVLFRKGVSVEFPIHPAYKPGYSIELSDENKSEIDNLIFVYTKIDVPWIRNKVNLNNILKWIFKIPIDLRVMQIKSIIQKQS